MATEREQRVMDAARALTAAQDAGRPLTPALLALVGAVCAADDAPQPTPAAPDAPHVAAIARRHAAAARIDRYRLPAEVLATLADVPALLAWIAAEPARTAAAVAGETERCIAATDALRARRGDHWTRAQHTAVAAVAWEMRPVATPSQGAAQ